MGDLTIDSSQMFLFIDPNYQYRSVRHLPKYHEVYTLRWFEAVADLHSKILDVCPRSIFFIFGKFAQIIGWYPTIGLVPPWESLDLPLHGYT